MEIEELLNKFNADDDFKKEILTLGKEKGTKAVLEKYNIPYTEEEFGEVLFAKIEQANCTKAGQYVFGSILTVGVGCVVYAIIDNV